MLPLPQILLLRSHRPIVKVLPPSIARLGISSWPFRSRQVLVMHLLVDSVLGLVDQPIVLLVGATDLQVDRMPEVIAQVLQPEVLIHLAGGVDSGGLAALGLAHHRAGGLQDVYHIVLLVAGGGGSPPGKRFHPGTLSEIPVDEPIGGLVDYGSWTGTASEILFLTGCSISKILKVVDSVSYIF